jgi:hypothetical protein
VVASYDAPIIQPVQHTQESVMPTPAMLRAGAEAAGVCLDESSVSFCELLAMRVFAAMESFREKQEYDAHES